MKILGIDPGTTQSAYVVWDSETMDILEYGIKENLELSAMLQFFQFDVCVIEMVASYGMAVGQTVFETCVWIGRFMNEIENYSCNVVRITRNQVKNAICHSSKANDSNIRQALIDMYGGDKKIAIGTKKKPGRLYGIVKDEWAALAVAIAWHKT